MPVIHGRMQTRTGRQLCGIATCSAAPLRALRRRLRPRRSSRQAKVRIDAPTRDSRCSSKCAARKSSPMTAHSRRSSHNVRLPDKAELESMPDVADAP